mmetsp:Transcript_3152/g.7191  ORF Transcript_3152/g.7191 Transcript_3152/m.7191 type:complete len:205 (-) Transcript_3152:2296-2910(-)
MLSVDSRFRMRRLSYRPFGAEQSANDNSLLLSSNFSIQNPWIHSCSVAWQKNPEWRPRDDNENAASSSSIMTFDSSFSISLLREVTEGWKEVEINACSNSSEQETNSDLAATSLLVRFSRNSVSTLSHFDSANFSALSRSIDALLHWFFGIGLVAMFIKSSRYCKSQSKLGSILASTVSTGFDIHGDVECGGNNFLKTSVNAKF